MNPLRPIAQAIAPLHRRVMLMIGRAVLRLVDDAGGLQRVQASLLAGETRSSVERFQQYGFTAHPLDGADALLLFIGGNRDHPVAVAVDDRRHRKRDLQPGEVAVYTDEGDFLLFKRGRLAELKVGSKLVIDCPRVEVTGDLIDRTGSGNPHTVQGMRDLYNAHVHPENDAGGPTDAPVPGSLMS
ncbi:phage baseplate assembly protein V [Tistlia consotensis]|uniref:Phage baseplate assembly protein V n=1 Tax=Tistlia consotensis USBA 355 TaxID=560819 RepID=A0A1Y6CXC0_9PROT|nr:phage baseplate assembly protein V [Tistlia consotensis]SMF77466.1 phage baseplate assembly protein V [Tistlia consotensis USBA 355]SMF83838.1 phage baseplate assembly protein V [Tistlia consotensis USBA 355]SNS34653.1 phage baseplate assembly protein V [Tistlia consotensis]